MKNFAAGIGTAIGLLLVIAIAVVVFPQIVNAILDVVIPSWR